MSKLIKTFFFDLTLMGRGTTEEAAWIDAVEAFFMDPGEPNETREATEDYYAILKEEEEEE